MAPELGGTVLELAASPPWRGTDHVESLVAAWLLKALFEEYGPICCRDCLNAVEKSAISVSRVVYVMVVPVGVAGLVVLPVNAYLK